MGKKTMKAAALAAMLGTVLQFGGCGSNFWRTAFVTALGYTGLEFVLDNDGVFDLFEGGATAANP